VIEPSPDDVDAIRELINIGVGRAAGMLNDITGCTIHLKVPSIQIVDIARFTDGTQNDGNTPLSTVSLSFRGPMSGLAALVFPPESAALLVILMTRESEESREMDAMRIETLKEVGNIIINAVMGSIANVLKQHLNYSLPDYQELGIRSLAKSLHTKVDDRLVIANAHFQIEKTLIEGNIMLILELGSMDTLICSIHSVNT
jgi:chemotaxis protein CheC